MQKIRPSASALMALAAMAMSSGFSTSSPTGRVLVSEDTEAARTSSNPSSQLTKNLGAKSAAERAFEKMFGVGVRFPNRPSRNPGPGWTHAHVQRMARKKRNQKRNRLAHR